MSDVETFIRGFVVLSRDQSTLITLWTAQTHVVEAFEYTAY